MIGKQLAHYQITALVGKGGMGEVYRATDTKLGRDVALKILPREFSADPERLARFQREARTLAALQHPNVASIYGLETDGDQTFLIMELVEGEDLSERLTRGALDLDKALEVAEQITGGMDAAHEKGIVHRDLKPANIKLGSDGSVKILDFGLARAMEGDPGPEQDLASSPTLTAAMTSPGAILGTAAYMSPEQARGRALDKRSDIFSFGVILYETLTGVCPFSGESVSDIIASILKEQADPEALPEETPPAIRLLIDRCLEKDPRKRIRDIGEAKLIIESVRSGDAGATTILGLPAFSEGAPEHRPRFGKREMGAWILAVILLAAFGWKMFGGGETAPVARDSYKLSVPIEGTSEIGFTKGGLSISPDGSRVAYINQNKLFIRRLDSWDPIEVPGSDNAVNPFWSPDSQWLAFALDKNLFRIRPDGTQRKLIATAESELSNISGGAWLEDDQIVFRGNNDLFVVPAAGGNPTIFFAARDSGFVDFHEPEALPGGQGLLVSVHRQEGVDTIQYVHLDGTIKTLKTIPGASLSDVCYSPTGHILFQERGTLYGIEFSKEDLQVRGDPFPVVQNTVLPSVSLNGTLVYVRGAGTIMRQFVLVDRTGNVTRRLGKPEALWSSFALSPDGTRAAGTHDPDYDLFMHDDRLASTLVSATGEEHDMISFSADGKTLYFGTGTQEAYRVGSKSIGRNEPEKTVVPAGELGPHYYGTCPAVDSEGKILFYSANGKNNKQDIAWVDLEGDPEPQRFLDSDAAEFGARPSPADSKYLAYVSNESGLDQVYLTTWPDGDQKLAVSIDGGRWPRWKADGTELYFAQANDIYAVEVSYEPLRLSTPVKLFALPDPDDRQPFGWPPTFDVTGDGQLFLVTELVQNDDADPVIAVIPNWSPSLE